MKKNYYLIILTILGLLSFFPVTKAEEYENFVINNHCIGNVCIGDTVDKIKSKYQEYVIKINDTDSGYYIFDNSGTFLIEFSTKEPLEKKTAPIRYIMTSNPNYTFENEDISVESKISDLMKKFGSPVYESGPNGYFVTFPKWPIKDSSKSKGYLINIIVGIYNPKLDDLFKFSGTFNEEAELKVLKEHPENTFLNTIEIFSDHYENGTPIN